MFHTEENFLLSDDLELHRLSWLFSSGAPLSRDLNRAHVRRQVEQLDVIWGSRLNLDIQYPGQECDRRSKQRVRKIECVITFQPLQNRADIFSPKWMMHLMPALLLC
jgi:hypothetical protein